jgi:NAD(P)-dependent dehydrogenase (short-subunit alcohol dehydrogenase family)
MKDRLDGKIAIVTGGGRGIGGAIALELATKGALVLIADLDFSSAQKTARRIIKAGHHAHAYGMNVSKKKEVDKVFQQVSGKFRRLDILVNNAGVSFLTPFEEISEKEWDQTLNTNLKGTFLCSQAAFRMMKSQRGGRIINIASGASRSGGMVSAGLYNPYAHYAASKAAIESLTRSLAFEGASYGILVNAVSPGPIETDLMRKTYPPEKKRRLIRTIPLGRLGRPEEVASAVAFLASDRAAYITAKVLDVNGGILMD